MAKTFIPVYLGQEEETFDSKNAVSIYYKTAAETVAQGEVQLNRSATSVGIAVEGSPFANIRYPWTYKKSPFRDVKLNANGQEIYCTTISNWNPFYISDNRVTKELQQIKWSKGASTAKIHPNYRTLFYKAVPSIYNNNGFSYNYKDSVLPNCVGWAEGRLRELYWASTKSLDIFIPQVSPINWWNQVKNKLGWRKLNSKESPVPGCVAIWDGGTYSHIAVVEAVYNVGTPEEYAVISNSSHPTSNSKDRYNSQPAWCGIIKKSRNWVDEYNDRFLYFIRTPICDLLFPDNELYNDGGIIIKETELTREMIDEIIRRVTVAKPDLKIGQKVEIVGIGYNSYSNSSKFINRIGGTVYLKEIKNGALHPYGLSATPDGIIFGWYDKRAVR